MAEIAGVALGALPVLIVSIGSLDKLGRTVGSIRDTYRQRNSTLTASAKPFATQRKEGGLIVACLLHTIFTDALFVMDRVERYVLHASDQHVVAFMKSYNTSFNMIGVAGAITAQVAISAMSLAKVEDTHWTAQAFFVVSLTTGALSVFFSCAVNPAFHGLHTAEDIKDFLTKPTPAAEKKIFRSQVSNIESRFGPELRNVQVKHLNTWRNHVEAGRWKVASPYAAMMMVVPMGLLKIAINTFLIGLGIYLGELHTANLIPSHGSGSVAILVFYIASGIFGLSIFYIPQSLKQLEVVPLKQWRKILDDYKRNQVRAGPGAEAEDPSTGENEIPTRLSSRHQSHQSGGVDPSHDNSEQPPTDQASFRQSVHSRDGRKVSYTIKENGTAHYVKPGKQKANLRSKEDGIESLEDFSPKDVIEERFGNEAEVPVLPCDRSPSFLDHEDLQAVLKTLIKAQEETLQATRRLLDLHATQITCE
ncbi:hypothetical protein BKA66DRAFT_569702 [Pyrenochaeta sp. MPI-SDFR-AT-0127]|nr:hypothetical protein BKA66DRAFT_569702 [Pyrenochaeta sp. MPI-SDFR-AT-0127]